MKVIFTRISSIRGNRCLCGVLVAYRIKILRTRSAQVKLGTGGHTPRTRQALARSLSRSLRSHAGGLALRPFRSFFWPGCQPPSPPALLAGFKRRSSRCPARRELTRSFEASRRCMKLQNPPRLHSPFSFCRQQASRKSVTGDSSAYKGRPTLYQHSFQEVSHQIVRLTCIPSLVQVIHSRLCLGLPFVATVYVPDEVVSNIVTDLRVC